jgi:hypothetical protein
MSVRYLALELYRLTRLVEDLEKTLANLELDAPLQERTRVEMELQHSRAELVRVRQVLNAKKEHPQI